MTLKTSLERRLESLEIQMAEQNKAHSRALELLARHASYFEAVHKLVEQWKFTMPELEGSNKSLKLQVDIIGDLCHAQTVLAGQFDARLDVLSVECERLLKHSIVLEQAVVVAGLTTTT